MSDLSRHCTPPGAAAQTAQPHPAHLLHGPFRVARALEPQAVRHGTHGVRVRPAALRLWRGGQAMGAEWHAAYRAWVFGQCTVRQPAARPPPQQSSTPQAHLLVCCCLLPLRLLRRLRLQHGSWAGVTVQDAAHCCPRCNFGHTQPHRQPCCRALLPTCCSLARRAAALAVATGSTAAPVPLPVPPAAAACSTALGF